MGRRMPPRSTSHAIQGSSNPTDGVNAARMSSAKNRVPMTRPPGISANATGSTSKTSCGPPAGSRP